MQVFSRRARLNHLAARLITSFVSISLLTTLAAGIPAYWLIARELEQQAWSRVADAQRVTATLLDAEKSRVENLVTLTAQRPTLAALIKRGTPSELTHYIRTLEASAGLDILVVQDASGQVLVSDTLPDEIELPAGDQAEVDVTSSQPAIVASQPVIDAQSGERLGMVTAGIVLDDAFLKRLSAQTGFEQSLIVDGKRSGSSLPNAPELASDVQVAGQAAASGTPQQAEVDMLGAPYHVSFLPLTGPSEQPSAVMEIALPVSALAAARQRALGVLTVITLLVAAVGSGVGGWMARRLAAPLERLTHAAFNISQGDLATPIPIDGHTSEIRTLATALEESRQHTFRTLEELSAAKEWSESLIQSITEGVVTFDTRGHITFFSEGAERITGTPSRDALDRPLDKVFPLVEPDERFMDHIPPRGGKTQVSVLTHDGRPVTLAVTGARLIPPHSSTVQIALVFRDVTEEEASRNLQSYFLANITHEFRTPLAALNASMELLVDEAQRVRDVGISELVGSLHLSVLRLQTLIENLLESTRIEAGRFDVRRRPTGLNEIVAEAIRITQPLLARRGQSLSLEEPISVPAISGDPTRLTQVLVNLLSNASKYSPPDTAIDLRVEQTQGRLRIAVLDRGPGIPEAERRNLFRRFMRLGSASAEAYGAGLGLFVAKTIVDGHGGQIGVDARPGGGSIFWFTLPLLQEASVHEDLDC